MNNKFLVLESAISDVRGGQQDIVRSLSFLEEKYEEMKVTTERLERENKGLQNENQALKKRVDDLDRQVQDLDQYHRRQNLEIAGIPEEKQENPADVALIISKRIDPDITAGDIDIAHGLGAPKPSAKHPRPIIVRFTNRRARNAVYDGRKHLRGTTSADLGINLRSTLKIYVNENLVGATRELLGLANGARKDAGYKFLWTYNGKIYVRKDEKSAPVIILSKEDISKLK
ncbi:uncharacterized protein LOC121419445 [Lytechinus variegatus]|uniref:uncharacterized protein LOC121419445 n=1 Tax=Lytechinus variegatus TaxID=7654 RepID=UPI001BB25E2B|nr:uncharacterized protein LOC121419445 [Lytechinus variegatus]